MTNKDDDESAPAAVVHSQDFSGYLDYAKDGHFVGWAADPLHPSSTVEIEFLIGDRLSGKASASQPREDITRLGFPGHHGFDFASVPANGRAGDAVRFRLSTLGQPGRRGELNIPAELLTTITRDMVIVSDLPERLASIENLIVFDVQDLINFLLHHNSVTGIQRVVGGIIQVVLSSASRDQALRFCMIGEEPGTVRILDEIGLKDLVDLAMLGNEAPETLRKKAVALKRRSVSHCLKSGDTFFVLGAYWIVPDFGVRLNILRQMGVRIGAYIYDLIPITAPQWVTDETRRGVSERAIDILITSDFFLTISQYVKVDVERLLQFELGISRRVCAVPLPHALPWRKTDATPVRASMRSLGKFVLCVGTLEGRKNHMLLFRIWAALLRKNGVTNTPALVIVGKWGWNIESLKQALSSSNYLSSKVKIFENIGDVELSFLYDHCLFSVFPSFIEGWGLPVGESLSCGKLCIASNASSIPEVGGDFCDYFDPHDFYEGYRVIDKAISDDDYLARRTENIVLKFMPRSWDAYVDSLVSTIRGEANRCKSNPIDSMASCLHPGRIYHFNEDKLILDQTQPWIYKARKFALISGWGALESWGCWSVAPECVLNLDLPAASGNQDLTIYLELRSANPDEGGSSATLATENESSGVILTSNPAWHAIHSRKGHAKRTIKFLAHFEPEPIRNLYIGISRLIIVDMNKVEGPALPQSILLDL